MNYHIFKYNFQELFNKSQTITITNNDKLVVLSDLHMGNKGNRDDLLHNQELLITLLNYYFDKNFTLILNGDIIDLSKYRYAEVMEAWQDVISIFDRFNSNGRLYQILGNHDSALNLYDYPFKLTDSLVLDYNDNKLFVLHGHQASRLLTKTPYISDFIVRFIARPLSIKNSSARKSAHARLAVEKLIYKASRELKIISLIGHTHRPLFDALSKYDNLRWTIEELFREYILAENSKKQQLAELIKLYKNELADIKRKDKARISKSLYAEEDLLIPCLFNSGCATGKTGITCLEIQQSMLALAYWSSISKARPYMDKEALDKEPMHNNSAVRYVIRRETLASIFDRITLLSE